MAIAWGILVIVSFILIVPCGMSWVSDRTDGNHDGLIGICGAIVWAIIFVGSAFLML